MQYTYFQLNERHRQGYQGNSGKINGTTMKSSTKKTATDTEEGTPDCTFHFAITLYITYCNLPLYCDFVHYLL